MDKRLPEAIRRVEGGDQCSATCSRCPPPPCEIGIDLEGRLTGVYFEPGHDFGPMLHFVFAASLPSGVVPTPSSDEIGGLDWWHPDDLPAPISDFTERRIRDAIGGLPSGVHVVPQRRWREGYISRPDRPGRHLPDTLPVGAGRPGYPIHPPGECLGTPGVHTPAPWVYWQIRPPTTRLVSA